MVCTGVLYSAENTRKNQKIKTGKQDSPRKVWDVQSVLFVTEKLNRSIGHSCKFLQGTRNLIIWSSSRDINSMELIGDKLRGTQAISVQSQWEAFLLTVKVNYFYHVQRFLIDSPLMVPTPCLKQWREYVSSSRHDLQPISLAYFSSPISLAYFSSLLGQQYSINVGKGFSSWAAETSYDHPFKVERACEGTVRGEGEQQEAT